MGYKADKLSKLIAARQGPIVVDVRSKSEFRQAHLPGAIHLPFWQVPFRAQSLKEHQDNEIVLYCEHGPRAVFARQALKSKGFDKAFCLDGHMHAWRKSGFPLQQL